MDMAIRVQPMDANHPSQKSIYNSYLDVHYEELILWPFNKNKIVTIYIISTLQHRFGVYIKRI